MLACASHEPSPTEQQPHADVSEAVAPVESEPAPPSALGDEPPGITRIGGNGPSNLVGGAGDDRLNGGRGDDVISAGGGRDEVLGGPGDDLIYGEDMSDRIHAGAGDDFVEGGGAFDMMIAGGRGDDELHAGPGGANLYGGFGDDLLVGSEEQEELHGGAGDDELIAGGGEDNIDAGPGRDIVHAGAGNDRISISAECEIEAGEIVDGGPGDDSLDAPIDRAALEQRGVVLRSIERVYVLPPKPEVCVHQDETLRFAEVIGEPTGRVEEVWVAEDGTQAPPGRRPSGKAYLHERVEVEITEALDGDLGEGDRIFVLSWGGHLPIDPDASARSIGCATRPRPDVTSTSSAVHMELLEYRRPGGGTDWRIAARFGAAGYLFRVAETWVVP